MQIAALTTLGMEPPKWFKYVPGILQPRCLCAWEEKAKSIYVHQRSTCITHQDDLNLNIHPDENP